MFVDRTSERISRVSILLHFILFPSRDLKLVFGSQETRHKIELLFSGIASNKERCVYRDGVVVHIYFYFRVGIFVLVLLDSQVDGNNT